MLNELVDENTDVSVARSREQTRECDVCGSRNGQAVAVRAPMKHIVEGTRS